MVLTGINILRILLAAMMFLCLADMPYGYYMLVRTVAMGAFAYFAFDACKNNQSELVFVYIGLSILFQPIIKISLGRELWNIIDVIIAVFLISLVFLSIRRAP